MVHFWFGFFLAAMVNVIHKLYIRLALTRFCNDGGLHQDQSNDVRHFDEILNFIPSLAFLFVITWTLSWTIFDNDHGFWIFWTYAVLFSILGIKLYDYKYPTNA